MGGALATVATMPFVAAEGSVGPGDVRVAMRWSWGGDTVLELPPLGRVVVDTHDTPLEIEARVTQLDIERAGDLAGDDDPFRSLEAQARVDVAPLVRDLVVRSLVVAVLAGAVAGALLPRRRWRHVALGAAAGPRRRRAGCRLRPGSGSTPTPSRHPASKARWSGHLRSSRP